MGQHTFCGVRVAKDGPSLVLLQLRLSVSFSKVIFEAYQSVTDIGFQLYSLKTSIQRFLSCLEFFPETRQVMNQR